MDKVMGLLRLLAPLAGRELALMFQQQPVQSQPEYHHFLHTMMSHAPVGIGKLDLDGKILWTNPAIEKMLGYSQSELLHRTAANSTAPELAAQRLLLRRAQAWRAHRLHPGEALPA